MPLLFHSQTRSILAFRRCRIAAAEEAFGVTIYSGENERDLESSAALTPDGVVDVDRRFGVRRFGGRRGSTCLDSNDGIPTHNVRPVCLDLPDRVQPPVRRNTTALCQPPLPLALADRPNAA
jgi:hypothetical protein